MATDKVPHDCVSRTPAGVAECANNGHMYEETVSDCTVFGLSRSSGEMFWPYMEIRALYGAPPRLKDAISYVHKSVAGALSPVRTGYIT